ncbi:Bug family tripartite tricarboxylate transporter substrate binding protein [Pseudonocardia nantongensis]|uniref:Bug family tripartite tricarboxylate transporter substrate binding protein n=1 Tax=Pseudonocardia nantongensis TaxID=1181885 RepID=UPI003977FA13
MTRTRRKRLAIAGLGLALTLSLSACGGNLGGGQAATADTYPDGPITMLVGQDPGGSTDLVGRALADRAGADLGAPIAVENRPGANGAIAAQELTGAEPDGQTLMVLVGSLSYITPLAVEPDQAIDLADFEIVSGLSQDDYVLVAGRNTGFRTIDDMKAAGRPINFGTTGVGTGSQLSSELLFQQAGIDATAVPFDGGSPTLTAVLGGQVDVAAIQLGEAVEQIRAGAITPIVTFAGQRVSYLPDTPTATEAGYPVQVQQSRAVVAPKGTPPEVLGELRTAFDTAFATPEYKEFNTQRLLTPNEVSGEELRTQWSSALENYRALVQKFGIDLGGSA